MSDTTEREEHLMQEVKNLRDKVATLEAEPRPPVTNDSLFQRVVDGKLDSADIAYITDLAGTLGAIYRELMDDIKAVSKYAGNFHPDTQSFSLVIDIPRTNLVSRSPRELKEYVSGLALQALEEGVARANSHS
jgi:hypothetical protein